MLDLVQVCCGDFVTFAVWLGLLVIFCYLLCSMFGFWFVLPRLRLLGDCYWLCSLIFVGLCWFVELVFGGVFVWSWVC